MNRLLTFKNKTVSFSEQGNGKAVVLLHGYVETKEIWHNLAIKLAEKYRVICIDLPAHGNTELFDSVNTMESMAEVVNAVLEHCSIEKCTLIGHSMGGYATLSFLDKYPEKLAGFSLFHSSPFADTEEKKENRKREIELLENGKKLLIYKNHFPNIFANQNQQKFENEIHTAIEAALKMESQAIIATLQGMMARANHSELLKNTPIPFLYILGVSDNLIPISILQKMQLPVNSTLVMLENSGHIGFIEEFEKSLEVLENFVQKV